MRIVEGLIEAANGSRAHRALEDLDKEYESVAALLKTEPRFSYCMNIPCAMVDWDLISGQMFQSKNIYASQLRGRRISRRI